MNSFRSPFAFLETVTHKFHVLHVHDAGCKSEGKTKEMVYIMFKIRNIAIVTLHSIFNFHLTLIYVFYLIIFYSKPSHAIFDSSLSLHKFLPENLCDILS